MVIAYHSIFTMYGFWLPNDPRGSYSDFVAAWNLWWESGKATKVNTRRSVAGRPHDPEQRLRVKNALQYDPVSFDDEQIHCVASGLAEAVRKSGYAVYACSILPEHVHMVIGRHKWLVERMAGHFKTEATMNLINRRLHPFQDLKRPGGRLVSCWAEKGWNVYLNTEHDVRRAIAYVRENPLKEARAAQRWDFEVACPDAGGGPRPDEQAG